MADVRSLLKEANAARNSSTGAEGAGKKRKAAIALSQSPGRKKAKSGPITPAAMDIVERQADEQPLVSTVRQAGEVHDHGVESSDPRHEEELAALDRDLAMMAAAHATSHNIEAAPAVSAPPMRVEDIAAQARIEQSAHPGRKEVEIEAEREDAAKALEDEFEAMVGLEERARRLRERREALRNTHSTEQGGDSEAATALPASSTHSPGGANQPRPRSAVERDDAEVNDDEDDDDDDDEDDFADWNFGVKA